MYERICNGPVGGDDGFWRDLTKERFLLQYGDYLD
jgi:hypothetical protein